MTTTTLRSTDLEQRAVTMHPAPPDNGRRTINARRWAVLIAKVLLPGGLFAISLFGALANPAQAQTVDPASKIAADLRATIAAPTTPKLSWAKDVSGVRYVKVLVISNGSDPDLVSMRGDVLAKGGSVYFRYVSVAVLSVLLPANRVAEVAARSDVQSISPNRMTARTASLLETTTGASTLRSMSGNTYFGLDGTGIGIAILDSGIAWNHMALRDATLTTSRVKRAVDFQKVGDATLVGLKEWTPGIDASASLYPGSPTLSTFESAINANGTDRSDPYGHGSVIASVAAGRVVAGATNDPTGIAPNANLYDVRVLDAGGFGQLSDVQIGRAHV